MRIDLEKMRRLPVFSERDMEWAKIVIDLCSEHREIHIGDQLLDLLMRLSMHGCVHYVERKGLMYFGGVLVNPCRRRI